MANTIDPIDEVFIKPIRSVLVVDDQFPRMERLLSGAKLDRYDIDRLSDLLKFCREEGPHWLVDVHDGKGLDKRQAPYGSLKQSDWLILDYNLSSDQNDGKAAINLVRRLGESENFNLVVIYTGKKTDSVFEEIIVSLSQKLRNEIQLTEEESAKLEKAIEAEEFAGTFDEAESLKQITLPVCIELLKNGLNVRNESNRDVLKPFFEGLGGTKFEGVHDLQKLLLKKLVRRRIDKMNSSTGRLFELEVSNSPDTKWLLAENVFVTIVDKNVSAPHELLKELRKALHDWNPSPNWLILAKLRAELDSAGIRVERQVFQDQTLQAFWLMELLKTRACERAHYIGGLLDRQTEEVSDILRTNVTGFAERVLNKLLVNNPDYVAVTRAFWKKIDPTEPNRRIEGIIAHNTYVSTKRPYGKNLMPGHVFKMGDDSSEFWICLSAACDLEAGREDSGRDLKRKLSPWMPFTAVKLHSEKVSTSLKYATRGYSLFLNVEGKRQQFSIFPDSNPVGSPVWEEFYADDEGRIVVGKALKLARLTPSSRKGGKPGLKALQAKIIAQVRTEYATTLAVRLSHHLSRIGLDFMGSEEKKVDTCTKASAKASSS